MDQYCKQKNHSDNGQLCSEHFLERDDKGLLSTYSIQLVTWYKQMRNVRLQIGENHSLYFCHILHQFC